MGNPVVFFEIGVRDRSRATEFYTTLFDWKTEEAENSTTIDTGSGTGEIKGHFVSLGHEPHNFINFYIQVDAIAPYLERIKALGGAVVVPEIPLPDGRSFAWVSDRDGNTIGLVTAAPSSPDA